MHLESKKAYSDLKIPQYETTQKSTIGKSMIRCMSNKNSYFNAGIGSIVYFAALGGLVLVLGLKICACKACTSSTVSKFAVRSKCFLVHVPLL